ncbi:hypothetical protein [Paraburkholderia sp. EG285A]
MARIDAPSMFRSDINAACFDWRQPSSAEGLMMQVPDRSGNG